MRIAAALIALLLATQAIAAEKYTLEMWLHSLPVMTGEDRAAFDNSARDMYDKICNCLVFMSSDDGKFREAKLPLTDDDRYTIIEGIRRGLFIPLPSKSERGS
jgi:hypothetical protein